MLSKLRLNENNPRTITPEKFERLKQSIRNFPKMLELRPVIYDETDLILGGNMRFRALQELVKEGFEIKDAYFKAAADLTEEEKQEFIIRDNIWDGEWDWDILSSQWEDIKLKDWGLDIQIDNFGSNESTDFEDNKVVTSSDEALVTIVLKKQDLETYRKDIEQLFAVLGDNAKCKIKS